MIRGTKYLGKELESNIDKLLYELSKDCDLEDPIARLYRKHVLERMQEVHKRITCTNARYIFINNKEVLLWKLIKKE